VKEPAAEPIFASVFSGTFFSERLKAVSRIRVVNTSSFSNGALAIEKVRVSLCVSFRWVSECQIGGLPRFEVESRRLFEVKGHRTFCNFFPAHQPGLNRHQDRIGSHGYLLDEVLNRP
jgi:hypothetical protein